MKALLIIAVIVVLAALAGWFTFSQSDGTATITIDAQEAKEDAQDAVNKGKELLEEAAESKEQPTDESSRNPPPQEEALR